MAIRNVWDLEAVTYPIALNLIKGTTAQFGTNTHIFFIVCYSQLIIKTMQECKWSYFKFGYYFQLTKSNVFQIIGKDKEEQWRTKFKVSFNWL